MLKQAGGGAIINLSSAAGRFGYAFRSPYAAAKWGVIGFTQSLAKELGPENIRVNALCPGPLQTELLMKYLNTEEKKQRRLVHIPMGRFGQAREIAQAALYLASAESSFVTGTEFLVDGGITAAYTTPL
jgi:NAD(P)-dependent dehydrogenase (short-subunit alcohol dehydrogenase family)